METESKEIIKVDDIHDLPVFKGPFIMSFMYRFIKAQDVSRSSKATYSRQLKQFFSWLEETGRIDALNSLQRQDILEYREYLLSINESSYTVDGYITSVRNFFEWLEGEKIYPNIARGVKGPKKAKGFRKDCLTPLKIREALSSINRENMEGLRDYALFNLLVRTGIRMPIPVISAT